MLSVIGWTISFILVFILSVPLYGLLIALEWGWFVAPILGTRQITMAEGVGLSMFLATAGLAATGHLRQFKTFESDDLRQIAAHYFTLLACIGVLGPIMGIFIAWTWHTLFM